MYDISYMHTCLLFYQYRTWQTYYTCASHSPQDGYTGDYHGVHTHVYRHTNLQWPRRRVVRWCSRYRQRTCTRTQQDSHQYSTARWWNICNPSLGIFSILPRCYHMERFDSCTSDLPSHATCFRMCWIANLCRRFPFRSRSRMQCARVCLLCGHISSVGRRCRCCTAGNTLQPQSTWTTGAHRLSCTRVSSPFSCSPVINKEEK